VTIRVERPAGLSTIQDLGRPGHRRAGVGPGGAVDPLALRVANILVGNPEDAAAIEITLVGPTLTFTRPAVVALAGADLGAAVDGRTVHTHRPLAVPAGGVLTFAGPRRGCRAYLACRGGFAIEPVLGGRGTDTIGRFGGVAGRPLAAGDVLETRGDDERVAAAAARLAAAPATWGAAAELRPAFTGVVRTLPGPEAAWFTPAARAAFFAAPFTVAADSDRMGARLEGPTLALATPRELESEAVVAGSVQVPSAGRPIVLLAGHATTGGYPRIATVAAVDLPEVGQAAPGARLVFRPIDPEESRRLLLARERSLAMLRQGLALAAARRGESFP
jgi:antagonist of KipI